MNSFTKKRNCTEDYYSNNSINDYCNRIKKLHPHSQHKLHCVCTRLLMFRFFLKKQSIYKEWLFSTLVAIAFYLLTYCFNLEEGFSVIFWSLIGSLITLISIWIYRYILNKNNCSHT